MGWPAVWTMYPPRRTADRHTTRVEGRHTVSTTIFVSHSGGVAAGRDVAREFDRLVERGFNGHIRTFNTSRQDRGLTSGARIDSALQTTLSDAALMVSIWSPSAVSNPAWMAWELGAASMTSLPILTARVLGTGLNDLPLGLSSRYAPELGEADEVVRLFQDIAEATGVELSESTVRGEYDRFGPRSSPLRASPAGEGAGLRILLPSVEHGLLENETGRVLSDITLAPHDDAPAASAVAAAVETGLRQRVDALGSTRARTTLDAHERVVFNLGPLTNGPETSVRLRAEWIAPDAGRQRQDLEVLLPLARTGSPS